MNRQAPTGRIRSKRRPFHDIVHDLRHTVFSVIRHRSADKGFLATALGSGFFVSSNVFLTCHHVVNSQTAPHIDGDKYELVANLTGTSGAVHAVAKGIVGQNIHLFPESDLALLLSNVKPDQAFVSLDYGHVLEGKEIGVAGYPLPSLPVVEGVLRYDGLVYRVAKGVVTATYSTHIVPDQGQALDSVPIIEVNFLFVPGNSGGPIFDAETGRVLAFVHGYRTEKIRERIEEASLIQSFPDGMERRYIENLNALYSLGIRMDRVRPNLEKFGVSL